MKRMLEINPLECPRCKSGMRIVAFVTDYKEVSKIMASLNIPHPVMPKPLERAPPDDFVPDELPDDDSFFS